jgi:hypothetical protein
VFCVCISCMMARQFCTRGGPWAPAVAANCWRTSLQLARIMSLMVDSIHRCEPSPDWRGQSQITERARAAQRQRPAAANAAVQCCLSGLRVEASAALPAASRLIWIYYY